MAKLNITQEEYPDLVVAFLFDKMLNPDEVILENTQFNEFIDVLEKKGLKSQLMKYYMDMNPNVRIKYKRMGRALKSEGEEKVEIVMQAGMDDSNVKKKDKKKGLVKKIFKKMLANEIVTRKDLAFIYEQITDDD